MLKPSAEDNDQLFVSLITFIRQYFPDLEDRVSLSVVNSRPRDALLRLREYGASDGQTGFATFDEEAKHAYMNRFCPETYQKWRSWPNKKKTLLASLFIGDTEVENGETLLVEPDFDDMETIFYWMCEQFVDKVPGPTLRQKFFRWISHE